MYARSAIAEREIVKSTGRNPGAAVKLFFTSTPNTVAGIELWWGIRHTIDVPKLDALVWIGCRSTKLTARGPSMDTRSESVSRTRAIAPSRKILCIAGPVLRTIHAPND